MTEDEIQRAISFAYNFLYEDLLAEKGDVTFEQYVMAKRLLGHEWSNEMIPEWLSEETRHETLWEAIEEITASGKLLPLLLQKYVVDAAKRTRKRARGRKAMTNEGRNAAIARAVYGVCLCYGLRPTRNVGFRRDTECGSSIVAMALEEFGAGMQRGYKVAVSEASVAKIWQRLGPALTEQIEQLRVINLKEPAGFHRSEDPETKRWQHFCILIRHYPVTESLYCCLVEAARHGGAHLEELLGELADLV